MNELHQNILSCIVKKSNDKLRLQLSRLLPPVVLKYFKYNTNELITLPYLAARYGFGELLVSIWWIYEKYIPLHELFYRIAEGGHHKLFTSFANKFSGHDLRKVDFDKVCYNIGVSGNIESYTQLLNYVVNDDKNRLRYSNPCSLTADALCGACTKDNRKFISTVLYVLEQMTEVEDFHQYENDIAYNTCLGEHIPLIDYLFERGVITNPLVVLYAACRVNKVNIFEYIVHKFNIDIFNISEEEWEPLVHGVIPHEDVTLFNIVLSRCSINHIIHLSDGIMVYICRNGYIPALKAFLEFLLDKNIEFNFGGIFAQVCYDKNVKVFNEFISFYRNNRSTYEAPISQLETLLTLAGEICPDCDEIITALRNLIEEY